MLKHLTPASVTQDVMSAVSAYLLARCHAEVMRSSVDEIARAVLAECPLTNGLEVEHGEPAREIADPKDAWLCTDEPVYADYLAECNKRERAAGLKPASVPDEHCPALVAEEVQREAESLVLATAAGMLDMGIDGKELNHRLLCKGLDTRREFIDLIVKIVVNHPEYKPPQIRRVA